MPAVIKNFEQFRAASDGARLYVFKSYGDGTISIRTSQFGWKGELTKEVQAFLAALPKSGKIEIDHFEDDAQFFS